MNNSMIGATAGASSPSKLAPETIRIRNALIEKYADQPIEELNKFLQHALEAEKDELKRLGLLAARVYILRQKVISLKAFIRDERMDKIPTPNLALTEQILLDETAHSDIDANSGTVTSGEWHSLQMIEPGEVNGVRFFQGTVINAKAEDAEKLISSGKAIFIDDEGNPVEANADDSGNSEDNLDPETIATTDDSEPDDKNTHDPNTLDATESLVNTGDPNADIIDETTADEATNDSSESDNIDTDGPNSRDATESVVNTDDDNTGDFNADAIDETAAAEATNDSSESDDKNTDNPNALDTTESVINTDDGNTGDLNADVIDESAAAEATDDSIALDIKNVEEPNVDKTAEDTADESTKNRGADGSEERKA